MGRSNAAKSFLLLLLLVVVGLAVAAVVDCNTEVDILQAQRIAWLDPHAVLQSWDPSLVNPCTWFHVTCNNDNSVIRVDLGQAGLIGPLVPQLGNLKNLQYLELYANSINGTIPKELGQLRNLVSLGLEQNRLSGTIPSSLGDIKSLEFLTLNGNELTGNLPVKILKLIAIGNLIVLNVSDNHLEGTSRRSGFATTQVIQDQRAFR